MNVQEYIASGIIESCVLGLADADEHAAFDQMCALHPAVREARDAFELSLEQSMIMNQSPPPRNLKSKIFAAIDLESDELQEMEQPVKSVRPPDKKIRTAGSRTSGIRKRYLAIAAVLALSGSTLLNFYFFNKYREYNEKYQSMVVQQTELATHNQVMQTRLLEFEKAVDLMKDPGMAIVKMPAVADSPDPLSAATVFWDTLSKQVYLAVSRLPEPGPGEQYQLWALEGGKPVDAGVFDPGEGPGVVKMKKISRAETFAVTLEKKGGSAVPNWQQLYLRGKIQRF